MTRPPPSSTLFPYTTLFRSRGARHRIRAIQSPRQGLPDRHDRREDDVCELRLPKHRAALHARGSQSESGHRGCPAERSEEHTSELQSLTNLVCRLLLEKKNK